MIPEDRHLFRDTARQAMRDRRTSYSFRYRGRGKDGKLKPFAPQPKAEPLVQKSKHHNHMHFLAHGMGLVSHEAPRLTATGPVPYDAYDAERPLESGMVVSVETTLQHPQRGFIKLEDTVVVTDSGFEIYGEGGRGWNRGGTAVR